VPRPEEAIPERWLDLLDESIRHRGPDGQGRFRDRAVRGDGCVVDVALVHRRLAIIDPACGHQPMVSERGRGAGTSRW
jgi:asparagine synthase (glutamine-hydrolysing)